MKILAFADLHGSTKEYKKLLQKAIKNKPDIVLCAGDFTVFEREMPSILRRINRLGKVYLIQGNHEQASLVKKMSKQYKNIKFVHRQVTKLKDYYLVAYGGGGFGIKDRDFEAFIKENKLKGKKIILMTHGPPRGTKLDYLKYFQDHAGCTSYTTFIKKYKPALAISGHLHENFGKEDMIGTTRLINPGPSGTIIEIP